MRPEYHDQVRSANTRLRRQPLWRFILIMFILYSLIWSFVAYAAAWASGGWHIASDDFGFQHGHLSMSYVLITASITTVVLTLSEIWRRRRQAR